MQARSCSLFKAIHQPFWSVAGLGASAQQIQQLDHQQRPET